MKNIDGLVDRILLHSQITDAGGGGTGKSFKRELENKNRIIMSIYDEYLSSTCALYGINLTLKNPVKIVMGEGGLMGRNALQLMHSAYNLQYGGGGGGMNTMNLKGFIFLFMDKNGRK